jgi:hypothetical protein
MLERSTVFEKLESSSERRFLAHSSRKRAPFGKISNLTLPRYG